MRIGEIKCTAKESLKNRKLKAAGETLIFVLITVVFPQIFDTKLQENFGSTSGSIISSIISIIISSAFVVGNYRYFISFFDRQKETSVSLLFSGFDSFLKVIGYQIILILIWTVIVFLCFLAGYGILFASHFSIIGIVFLSIIGLILLIACIYIVLRLSFVTMIFADNESMGIFASIKESFSLTKGYVLKLFLFNLSFIGWILLCIFILPAFYVLPYFQLSQVSFYYDLKKIKETTNTPISEFLPIL